MSRAADPKRFQFNTRLRISLRDSLEREAMRAGRSLSEEIERRLELSLENQNDLEQALLLAFGPQVAAFALATAFAVKQAADHSMIFSGIPISVNERPWLNNAFAYHQVATAVNELIRGLEPDEAPVEPALLQSLPGSFGEIRDVINNAGRSAATTVCRAIVDPQPNGPLGPWARVIHDWLGEDTVGRIRDALRGRAD